MIIYEQFCKRTEDPKLAYIERLLDERGIAHKRDGHSWHAPILMVDAAKFDEAWALLSLVIDQDEQDKDILLDDIPDDDAMFKEN